VASLGIKKQIEPDARRNSVVVVALGADIEIVPQVGVIQHGFTRSAFAPQSLGHSFFFATFLAFDLGREEFLEPAH